MHKETLFYYITKRILNGEKILKRYYMGNSDGVLVPDYDIIKHFIQFDLNIDQYRNWIKDHMREGKGQISIITAIYSNLKGYYKVSINYDKNFLNDFFNDIRSIETDVWIKNSHTRKILSSFAAKHNLSKKVFELF